MLSAVLPNKLAEGVAEGRVSPDELVDAISMSHFNVCDEGDTDRVTDVLEDMVHRNLKGRLGHKLITSVIDELDNNDLLTTDKNKIVALLEHHGSESPEVNENLPIGTTQIFNNWHKSLEEVNYDKLRWVKFDEIEENRGKL